jgi:hypothetical protein
LEVRIRSRNNGPRTGSGAVASDLSVLCSLGGFRVDIYIGLGELAQRTVGVLLFLECRVEKLDGFVIAEFFGPAFPCPYREIS